METNNKKKIAAYLPGIDPNPGKTLADLKEAGYTVNNAYWIKAVISADVVCIYPGKYKSLIEKIVRFIGKEVIEIDKVREMNAKKTNIKKASVLSFVDRAVLNKKVVFNREDPRISEYLSITESLGVLWRPEPEDITEENPLGLSRDPFRRFYVYKSERDGYLLGVQGGDEDYFAQSGEEEITPETFFELASETKIKTYL